MRAIFVNHCHPDCAHVCGTRAREFANALARQGHKIILLTQTLRREDPAPDPSAVAQALLSHDWSAPFRLAVPPRRAPVLEALRSGRLPMWMRGAVIAYQYLVRCGMFTDWRDATRDYWRSVVEAFHPEVVWGVFGNTDCWAIAQGLAREAGCSWVRDIKDRWTGFIPRVFRPWLAWQFRDAAATTALARSLVVDATPWLGRDGAVIYSGLQLNLVTERPKLTNQLFTLVLVGGIYERASLERLVDGIGRLAAIPGMARVRLIYVGGDTDTVRAVTRGLSDRVVVEISGLRPFPEYCDLIAGADVNLYIRVSGPAWHHKIVELAAVGRPIMCVPGEISEARDLVRCCGGTLHEAADAEAIAAVLAKLYSERSAATPTGAGTGGAARLSWDALASDLAGVLIHTTAIDKAGDGDYRGAGRFRGGG